MDKKVGFILFIIVLLSLAVRLIGLNNFPPALNWDEVSHGYNAYSILETGMDQWGQAYPLTNFRAYGDYPLPLNLYLTIPFISVLGLNEWSIRLPHALLGVGVVISVFFLAWGLTKDKRISLLTSFIYSLAPWALFPSRFVAQSNLSVFLVTTSMALFFNRSVKRWFLPLSILLGGLSLYAYHSTRIFTPLFVLSIIVIYRKDILKKYSKEKVKTIMLGILTFVMFLPLPFILLNPEARARSSEVFLVDQGAVSKIEQNRVDSSLPPLVSRMVYNRPVYFASSTIRNYIDYYSPTFLFVKGGTNWQFSIPDTGLLYLVSLPFFYLGLYLIIVRSIKGDKKYQVILAWLIMAPLAAAITKERYAILRSTTMLPIPMILTSLGFFHVFDYLNRLKKKKSIINLANIMLVVYVGIIFVSLGCYLRQYFGKYSEEYSQVWQYGYKEAVEYAKDNHDSYDYIIFTKKYGEPHEFVLFFWPWSPKKYQEDPNLIAFAQSNWYWVDAFDKFVFVNDWDLEVDGNVFTLESGGEIDCNINKCLLITSPGNYPEGWEVLNQINFLDGSGAFEIVERNYDE
ncbi:ArnT family glycosyltransferase [Patescibacteria group bacterium]